MKKPIRLRITNSMANGANNKSYIVVRNGKVDYVSGTEKALELALIAGPDASELRFALEEAKDGASATKAFRQYVPVGPDKLIINVEEI